MESYSTSDARTIEYANEVKHAQNALLFRLWIERMHAKFPNMTYTQYHLLMKEDAELFDDIKRNICYGDSIMIDMTNPTEFKCPGRYRLIDYPEIGIPDYGASVTICGQPHYVTDAGFLTFDAEPFCNCDEDSDELGFNDSAA